MKIASGVEILEGLPILYIKPLSAIVCSDLHLGYEGVMADRGSFVPKVNLKNIKKSIEEAVKKTGAKAIIVDGDIKNEFSKVHIEEFNEFHEFVGFLRKIGIVKIILIKGNHDNFIDRLKKPLGIEVHTQEALISDFLFFHGEKLPRSKKGKMLIMGHVHPAITLYSRIGIKEKLKCFLYGRMEDGREAVVLPAMNYFAEGVGVNMENVSKMAPVFKRMLNVDEMKALCIGEGETLDFGTIRQLRKIG